MNFGLTERYYVYTINTTAFTAITAICEANWLKLKLLGNFLGEFQLNKRNCYDYYTDAKGIVTETLKIGIWYQ